LFQTATFTITDKSMAMDVETIKSLFWDATRPTEEKMKTLRKYREDQYESLIDAVYKRRGWNNNGEPEIEFLEKTGMDLPEVLEVVRN